MFYLFSIFYWQMFLFTLLEGNYLQLLKFCYDGIGKLRQIVRLASAKN